MAEERISRINALAKKQRETGLNQVELAEQAKLRREYIDSMKQSLVSQLENTYLVDQTGNKQKVTKKK